MKKHKNYLAQRKKDKLRKIYIFIGVSVFYMLIALVAYLFI